MSQLFLLSISIDGKLEQVHITILLVAVLQIVTACKHVFIRRVLLSIWLRKIIAKVHEISKMIVVAISLDVCFGRHQMVRVIFDLFNTVKALLFRTIVEGSHTDLGLRRLEVHS